MLEPYVKEGIGRVVLSCMSVSMSLAVWHRYSSAVTCGNGTLMCGWEPVHGQCIADAEGAGYIAFVAAVVFDGWADVPAIDAAGSHVRTLGWGDMNDNASTWWGKGTLVEIEISV